MPAKELPLAGIFALPCHFDGLSDSDLAEIFLDGKVADLVYCFLRDTSARRQTQGRYQPFLKKEYNV